MVVWAPAIISTRCLCRERCRIPPAPATPSSAPSSTRWPPGSRCTPRCAWRRWSPPATAPRWARARGCRGARSCAKTCCERKPPFFGPGGIGRLRTSCGGALCCVLYPPIWALLPLHFCLLSLLLGALSSGLSIYFSVGVERCYSRDLACGTSRPYEYRSLPHALREHSLFAVTLHCGAACPGPHAAKSKQVMQRLGTEAVTRVGGRVTCENWQSKAGRGGRAALYEKNSREQVLKRAGGGAYCSGAYQRGHCKNVPAAFHVKVQSVSRACMCVHVRWAGPHYLSQHYAGTPAANAAARTHATGQPAVGRACLAAPQGGSVRAVLRLPAAAAALPAPVDASLKNERKSACEERHWEEKSLVSTLHPPLMRQRKGREPAARGASCGAPHPAAGGGVSRPVAPNNYSKKARLWLGLPGRPRGGVGGRSSFTACSQPWAEGQGRSTEVKRR